MRARSARDGLQREIAELEVALARSYGVRAAVYEQLRKFDPGNPLLTDESLRSRIANAAESAFINNPDPDGRLSYDRARDVGRTFKIPGR